MDGFVDCENSSGRKIWKSLLIGDMLTGTVTRDHHDSTQREAGCVTGGGPVQVSHD
jgi:hypothetical protein